MNKILKFGCLFVLLFCGCSEENFHTPGYEYHEWKVSVYAPSGELHKEYIVKSVDRPIVRYEYKKTKVYTLNTKTGLLDSVCSETGIVVPNGWLIEVND